MIIVNFPKSNSDFLNYLLEQLHGIDDVTYRAMMGGYVVYYRNKVVGGIYYDRLMVKNISSAKSFMKDFTLEVPYEGAKEMILVKEVDNTNYLKDLFDSMFDELPEPKIKNKRKSLTT